jgi:hypothetical protein
VTRPRPAPLALLGLAAGLAVLLLSTRDVFWTGDFMDEAWPAYLALQEGDLGLFLRELPGYSGFTLLVGGPLAYLAGLLGGEETAALRAVALPGIAALALLGAHLATQVADRRARVLVVLLAAAGPLVHLAIAAGHPEELLAAAATVGAVLVARHDRPVAAALLVVLAVLAKQWAVLAIGPALLALPATRPRIVFAALALAGTGAVIGAQTLLHPLSAEALTNTGPLFHPQQLFWPLGVDAPAWFAEAGHGERTAPAWLTTFTRPLIVGISVPLTLVAWRRRTDPLALLALLLLLRCLLDPWNLGYYHLPLVTALLALEVSERRPWPVLTLATTALVWLSFVTIDARTGDLPYLMYLAWTLPLAAVLLAYPRPSWLAGPSSAARPPSPSTSTP